MEGAAEAEKEGILWGVAEEALEGGMEVGG